MYLGNRYGTSKKAVMDVLNHGKLCLLDIDSQGVKNVKKTDLNPVYIFIKPPNMQVLEQPAALPRHGDRGGHPEAIGRGRHGDGLRRHTGQLRLRDRER